MDSERLRVLKMLEEGRINAAEAAKLLDALAARPSAQSAGRVLRIRIVEPDGTRSQTTVALPLNVAQTLARAGSRVGMFWAPQLGEFDLPAILDAVERGETGRVVEWTEGERGRRYEVSIE